LADFPVEVVELEAMLESFESFDAFRCACPIPNTDSIIDVACPVEEVTTVADTKIFFMGVEKSVAHMQAGGVPMAVPDNCFQ